MEKLEDLSNSESEDDIDSEETQEWLDSLEAVIELDGKTRANYLLNKLQNLLASQGFGSQKNFIAPYKNTIAKEVEASFPGDLAMEKKITAFMRWNVMAMVLRANKVSDGIGGHIASYASSASLYEVGFNHFFRGYDKNQIGDQVFFQGHSSPGIYTRAFFEGRLNETHLLNFRRELSAGGGLPSYPHPRLLNNFWQYPTVSMGLGPIISIYLARFYKYMLNRKLVDTSTIKVWAFLGDGETDEPESLGSLAFASYQRLGNLIFVINCNLQKLDGPVRSNGNIIKELEANFSGAGWNVIKLIWGSSWDKIFEKDTEGAVLKLMEATVDGDFQRFSTLTGKELREQFFGRSKMAAKVASHFSDEELDALERGGHDEEKIYAAYHKAINMNNDRPTVILVKTVKGYGMGDTGEGRNIAHQQKKMHNKALLQFKKRFSLPLSDQEVADYKFIKPDDQKEAVDYLHARRKALGGYLPRRPEVKIDIVIPKEEMYEKFYQGSGDRAISTTMALVQILSSLLKEKDFGKRVVPIIPDESRTFGIEGLFRLYGIYAPRGQIYQSVDEGSLLPYREAKDGQILEEGITEAGAISSFITAGTAYSHLNYPMVPFYFFYSMFGFQRIGDLVWAASDMLCKGFLVGGTAGRTTLNGEGLQHEDGHSHVLASTFPTLQAYDPAYGYELAIIVKDGIKRMYVDNEDVFYYLTVYNENYLQIKMPATPNIEAGIINGMYKLKASVKNYSHKVNLFASGVAVKQALEASKILEDKYKIRVDIWSITSYKRLREDTLEVEKWNKHNALKQPRQSYLQKILQDVEGIFVAVTDYMQSLPDMISRWIPGGLATLGTDGFGLSASRKELRSHFEVNANNIVLTVLYQLSIKKEIDASIVAKAHKELKD